MKHLKMLFYIPYALFWIGFTCIWLVVLMVLYEFTGFEEERLEKEKRDDMA